MGNVRVSPWGRPRASIPFRGGTSQAHPLQRAGLGLLERNLGAAVFELLLEFFGFLLADVFLDRLGRAFDQVLGFLQTQARDLTYHLDNVDLLGSIETIEHDREL